MSDDEVTPPLGTQLTDEEREHADRNQEQRMLLKYGHLCTRWDATNGMRCCVDGCTHNASGSSGSCPHHEHHDEKPAIATPTAVSAR